MDLRLSEIIPKNLTYSWMSNIKHGGNFPLRQLSLESYDFINIYLCKLYAMKGAMVCPRNKLQIFNSIIKFVAIYMVDTFIRGIEFSPKMLRHYKLVFCNISIIAGVGVFRHSDKPSPSEDIRATFPRMVIFTRRSMARDVKVYLTLLDFIFVTFFRNYFFTATARANHIKPPFWTMIIQQLKLINNYFNSVWNVEYAP